MNRTYGHYTVILLHPCLPLNPEGMSRVTRTWHKVRISVKVTLIYGLKKFSHAAKDMRQKEKKY